MAQTMRPIFLYNYERTDKIVKASLGKNKKPLSLTLIHDFLKIKIFFKEKSFVLYHCAKVKEILRAALELWLF